MIPQSLSTQSSVLGVHEVSKVTETRTRMANYATPLVQCLIKIVFFLSVQETPHLYETNSFIPIVTKSHHLIQLNQFGAVYDTPFLLLPFKCSLPIYAMVSPRIGDYQIQEYHMYNAKQNLSSSFKRKASELNNCGSKPLPILPMILKFIGACINHLDS